MLGEIDCREGLLLAVDKLKYDTMEEATAVLVRVYSRALHPTLAGLMTGGRDSVCRVWDMRTKCARPCRPGSAARHGGL